MHKARNEFLHHRNVANYTRLLRDAPDDPRRKMLLSLLAEELANATANGWPPTQPA